MVMRFAKLRLVSVWHELVRSDVEYEVARARPGEVLRVRLLRGKDSAVMSGLLSLV